MTRFDGVTLHVCTTCRGAEAAREAPAGEAPAGALPAGALPAGARLHDALAALLAGAPGPAPRLLPVQCLANCDRGCSAAISMAGKWSYLLGGLAPAHAADLLAYAASYAAARTGTVMPSRRPPTLAAMIVGRVPSPEMAQGAAP